MQISITDDVQVMQVQVPGIAGPQGPKGDPGSANVLTIGTVTTLAAGQNAVATISGVSPNQTLNLSIPQGAKGDTGPAGVTPTLSSGTINTGAPGTDVIATLTGTAPNYLLNLTIPRGAPPILSATSPDTVTISQTAGIVLSLDSASDLAVGNYVRVEAQTSPGLYMAGYVTAVSGTSLTFTSQESAGSGAYTGWTITLTGKKGNNPSIAVGSVTGLAAGSAPTVTNSGTNQAAVFDFGIPAGAAGADGADGAAANMTIGTVTTLAAGSSATATVTGTAPNFVLNLGIPQGAAGSGGLGKNSQLSLTANTDYFTKIDTIDDGTATTNWPNRMEFSFTPVGGTRGLTTYMNEYGELRIEPGKSNTVPFRIFTKHAAADPAHTVNVMELMDDRVTRTTLAYLDTAGRWYTNTTAPASANELTRKDYVDALGTTSPTADTIVRRDGGGGTQLLYAYGLQAPNNPDDAANKGYVDTQDTAISNRVTTLEGYNQVLVLASGDPIPAGTPANTVIFRK